MTDREQALRHGQTEAHSVGGHVMIFLYWEPHFDAGKAMQSFTIDYGTLRWREQYFDKAVARLEELVRMETRINAAKALGISVVLEEDKLN